MSADGVGRVDGRLVDLVRGRIAGVSAVTIDVQAPDGLLAGAARESFAWTRALLGSPLVFASRGRAPHAVHALLDADGVPVVVGFAVSAAVRSRVGLLGPVRCEVTLRDGRAEARLDSEEGSLVLAPSWSDTAAAVDVDDDAGADDALTRHILGELLAHRPQ